MTSIDCPYCKPVGEKVLWQGRTSRVTTANEPGYPYWCRVVWNAHVKEFSDLDRDDREALMNVVAALEQALIAELAPAKINFATLGTQVPHLHFHIIPRFTDDPAYPAPVWNLPVSGLLKAPCTAAIERVAKRLTDSLGTV